MTFDLVQNGSVRLEMKFKTTVVETLTTLVYAEYDNLLEIDQDRSGVLDYLYRVQILSFLILLSYSNE